MTLIKGAGQWCDFSRNMLQRTVDHSIKDYNLLVIGNKSLLCEGNYLKSHCEDL
jgi:hypothetical protein